MGRKWLAVQLAKVRYQNLEYRARKNREEYENYVRRVLFLQTSYIYLYKNDLARLLDML
jgi:hypothetical protein